MASAISVAVSPGAMATARMPYLASSMPHVLVMPTTPALAAL